MKRKATIIISLSAITLSIIALIIAVGLFVNKPPSHSKESFLITSTSPDGEYVLNAYRTEPGATTDFSVKVYLNDNKSEKLIYDAYHESSVDIVWIDDSNVEINGKVLNLEKNEKYNWRTEGTVYGN